jgi:hypothetical protein
MLPKLLFRSSGWWSETTVLIGAYALAGVGFAATLRQNAYLGRPYSPRQIGTLLLLVVASCMLIFSLSYAGSGRGWTVRYIAPAYVVVPPFLSLGVERLWHWSKLLAIATVTALLVPNLLLYGLPGSPLRAELTAELSNYINVQRTLARAHVRMVYGDYFWVYHLNFDSDERIAGVPSVPVVDYYGYGARLGTSSVRWALLGGADEVKRLARAVHAHGALTKDGDLWLFVADKAAPNAATLIATLRNQR